MQPVKCATIRARQGLRYAGRNIGQELPRTDRQNVRGVLLAIVLRAEYKILLHNQGADKGGM